MQKVENHKNKIKISRTYYNRSVGRCYFYRRIWGVFIENVSALVSVEYVGVISNSKRRKIVFL